MTLDRRAEAARGYMILGIFYVHALTAFATTRTDPAAAWSAFVQIKLLAPHVAVFFFLSGMGARAIGRRSFASIAEHSLMLAILAAASQAVGYLVGPLLSGPPHTLNAHLHLLAKPIVYGTGYVTYVAWFFVVLAAVRPLVWLLERSRTWFALAALGLTALVLAGQRLGAPDNLWEWRNWPLGFLFFVAGSRVPRDRAVPLWLGVSGLAATLLLAWFNRPGLLREGPCLACDILFVGQPMVGSWGSLPVLLVQEAAFLAFLLWGAEKGMADRIDGPARTFGRASIQYLLLHGWLMAAALPLVLPLLPARGSAWLFAAFLLVVPAIHYVAFLILRRPVERVLSASFALARGLVSLASRPFEVRRG